MRPSRLLLVVVSLVIPSVSLGAGLARNSNFIILASDKPLAKEVLARAEGFRQEVAQEWLGEPLPPSVGPAIINVTIAENEDHGLTWAIDGKRNYHKVWLTTSHARATGSTLRHEITHVVLATRYPNRLPPWAEEGAASLSDDQARFDRRRRIVDWYARTGNWPDLNKVFDMKILAADDQASYSTAASVTRYLLSHGDKKKFLAFTVAGKEAGWNWALKEHYGINGVRALQAEWQAWAVRGLTTSSRNSSAPPPSYGHLPTRVSRTVASETGQGLTTFPGTTR